MKTTNGFIKAIQKKSGLGLKGHVLSWEEPVENATSSSFFAEKRMIQLFADCKVVTEDEWNQMFLQQTVAKAIVNELEEEDEDLE